MIKKKIRPYDSEVYSAFGEQPYVIEIQIGYMLKTLIEAEQPIIKELSCVRNEIDIEFGLPLPEIRVKLNPILDPTEYSILLNGTKVGGFKELSCNQILCLDIDKVKEKLSGDCVFTKEPAFGYDAIIIDKSRLEEAEGKGYSCSNLERVIRVQLTQLVESNLTLFLNQCMVNTLINKVRPVNPDVIDNVFFEKGFTTSKMKKVLNILLEEKVSIRDMNTILETIADNIETNSTPLYLAERVREKLAYQFLSKYVNENNTIYTVRVGPFFTEEVTKSLEVPENDPEHPYIALDSEERSKILENVSEQLQNAANNNQPPVFLCHTVLRRGLFVTLAYTFPEIKVISDTEVFSCKGKYSLKIIGEINE